MKLKNKLINSLSILLIGCSMPDYWMSIDKKGVLFIVDRDKYIELEINRLKYLYDKESEEFEQSKKVLMMDSNISKSIGLILKVGGKLSPSTTMPIGVYPCKIKGENILLPEWNEAEWDERKKYFYNFNVELINKNEAFLLMKKLTLNKIGILEQNLSNDDLCIQSYELKRKDMNNLNNIRQEKYIIKITQEELNKALEELNEVSEK